MWFGKRKSRVEETKSLASPDLALLELFQAAPAVSGVSVTPQNALKCAPVRRAISALAEPIGQLPLHLYRRDGDARTRDRDHPAAKVLMDPNPWTTGSDFREQLQRDVLLHGNAYSYINRADNKPVELLRLDPPSVTVTVDLATGEPSYTVTTNGQKRVYAFGDVLHLKSASTDGYCGRSIINDCREAIGVALVLEKHAAGLFGRGGRPDGLLKTSDKLGAEASARIGAAWKAAFGSGRSGGTPVLEHGLEFQPLTFSSVDSQYLELRRFMTDEIARCFNVPPHLLYEMGRATWGNSAEMASNFVTFSLMRWVKMWQAELRLKLLNEQERADYYFEFELNDLLKADVSARADAYGKLISSRVMNPNECRARENLPPYPAGNEFINPNTIATPAPAKPALREAA